MTEKGIFYAAAHKNTGVGCGSTGSTNEVRRVRTALQLEFHTLLKDVVEPYGIHTELYDFQQYPVRRPAKTQASLHHHDFA